ncbi:MAG TPA: hypothetical protein VIJ93_13995 [bacterium]
MILGVLSSLLSMGAIHLKAATIEVENDDEDVLTSPTPAPPVSNSKIEKKQASSEGSSPSAEKPLVKTRIDDSIGFYYFVKSGYVVPDESKIPSIGHVLSGIDNQISYSTPHKTFIELSPKMSVKVDDILVVYHATDPVREAHSGEVGIWVRNLAIVRVVEIQKQRCLVEVKASFGTFQEKDKVKLYDDEIQRWNQAHVKKEITNRSIKCYVAGGEPGQDYFNQTDFILLTAGKKNGVVEGQIFRIDEQKGGNFIEDSIRVPKGKAKVFFVGPNYSVAQILSNHESIKNGFVAFYQP